MDKGIQSDWRFFIDDREEKDWAYNWDYAESSTLKPRSAKGCATLFLMLTFDPLEDFRRRYIDSVNRDERRNEKVSFTLIDSDDGNEDEKVGNKKVTIRSSKNAIIEGYLHYCFHDNCLHDPNVGNYGVFTSKNMAGYKLMRYLKATTHHGYAAFIDHSNLSIPLLDGIQMHIVTGVF